ncbi:MAG: anti-sigma B factor antagonist [Actinobacteria bacterium HGW-Actinobacteria-1]|jgi:anti-sigma B factor antagonist|nr:MAG: anti-sigma B factor antagonist [Actinobacteria bacterium HGW-Actinobacteria-1]
MELDISTERDGSTCRIAVNGEVDVYTSPLLKSYLVDAVDDGCIDLVVDLENVGFIDSSGLGVLVSGLRRVKEQSGSMRIICTKEGILKIFRITGLDKVFPIFASAADAEGF